MGIKVKKRWLTSEADLKEMYEAYKGKKEILLWCTTDNEKRSHAPDNEETISKRPKGGHEGHVEKMAAVEEIEEKLRIKHKGVYTEEQIRCWAHLIK